jgi:subtilisin
MAASYAEQMLEATGSARVIVVLSGAKPSADLERCFTWGTVPEGLRPPSREKPDPGPMRILPNLGIAYGNVDRAGWKRLRSGLPDVNSVSGAPPLRPIRSHNSVKAKLTGPIAWGVQKLGVPELWRQGLTGKGIRVGHMDTGVDGTHPALKAAVSGFALFDASGELDTTQTQPIDTAGHGTHTAGTIAGRRVGGRAIGVAPGCELICGAVIEGGDIIARVLSGVDWALGKGIRVLNCSLGFPGYSPEFLPVLDIIRARGILPVFAVGNEGPDTSRSPGNYVAAVSVGAIDEHGKVDPESSSQRFDRTANPLVPDLVTPGVGIISSDAGGGYRSDDGTSMAAAHVSGLAALLWEAKPSATVDEIEQAIYGSCALPAAAAPDRANRGCPHAARALKLLMKPSGRTLTAGGLPT